MIKLSGGKSTKNWIGFSAYTDYSISINDLLKDKKELNELDSLFEKHEIHATAIREENGDITIKYEKNSFNEFKFNSLTSKCITLIYLLLGLSLQVKSLVLIPLIRNNMIGNQFYLIPMFLYFVAVFLSILILRIYGGKELTKNHGAEHMTSLAYKKLCRIPTIDEVKKFSRFSKYCGISIFSALITAQIIGFVVFITTGFKISEILLLVIPLIFSSSFPFYLLGLFFQVFTTSKPDDANIELAIAALSALEEKMN